MNKLFKAYANLIDSFHKIYEDRNNEIHFNTDYKITKMEEKWEKSIKEKDAICNDLRSK